MCAGGRATDGDAEADDSADDVFAWCARLTERRGKAATDSGRGELLVDRRGRGGRNWYGCGGEEEGIATEGRVRSTQQSDGCIYHLLEEIGSVMAGQRCPSGLVVCGRCWGLLGVRVSSWPARLDCVEYCGTQRQVRSGDGGDPGNCQRCVRYHCGSKVTFGPLHYA